VEQTSGAANSMLPEIRSSSQVYGEVRERGARAATGPGRAGQAKVDGPSRHPRPGPNLPNGGLRSTTTALASGAVRGGIEPGLHEFDL
jgi:hypothetical protein